MKQHATDMKQHLKDVLHVAHLSEVRGRPLALVAPIILDRPTDVGCWLKRRSRTFGSQQDKLMLTAPLLPIIVVQARLVRLSRTLAAMPDSSNMLPGSGTNALASRT